MVSQDRKCSTLYKKSKSFFIVIKTDIYNLYIYTYYKPKNITQSLFVKWFYFSIAYNTLYYTHTLWEVSVFRVYLVYILPHLD